MKTIADIGTTLAGQSETIAVLVLNVRETLLDINRSVPLAI
jgi:hypothetical protein